MQKANKAAASLKVFFLMKILLFGLSGGRFARASRAG